MNTTPQNDDTTIKHRRSLFVATIEALVKKYEKLPPLDQVWLISRITDIFHTNPPGWQRHGYFDSNLARSIREQKELSQKELARLTGVAQTNLSKYEGGKVTPRGNSPGSRNYLEWLAQNGYRA